MHFPTMRFKQVSRALVARVFRFLAFLVVEIDHQSGNFSKILPLRSNVHWKSKIDSAIMAVARALRPGRGCPSEETTPEIVQCDRTMLPQRGPRSSSGVPRLALLSHLTLEAIARREKPIANQPIERA
jgi:hypothetical protein